MEDKDTENGLSSPVSLLFCEKSLSLFNDKEKERRVRLNEKNKKIEEKDVGWMAVAEELDGRGPFLY